MKSSGLAEKVERDLSLRMGVSIDTDLQKLLELNIIDDHMISLISRMMQEKIANTIPSIIEAVKMDLKGE